jgi:hypothetical protein
MTVVTRLPLISAIFTVVLTSAFTLNAENESGKKKIGSNEVPPVVLSAFKKSYPHARIAKISEETEEDTELFEIESKDNQVERKLLYTAEGELIKTEEAILKTDVPAAITKTVNAAYPECTITSAEKITRGNDVHYEIIIVKSKHTYDLFLSGDGKFIPSDEESQGAVDDD